MFKRSIFLAPIFLAEMASGLSAVSLLPPPLAVSYSQLTEGEVGLVQIDTSYDRYDVKRIAEHQNTDLTVEIDDTAIMTILNTKVPHLSLGMNYSSEHAISKTNFAAKSLSPAFDSIKTQFRYETVESIALYKPHPNLKIVASAEHIAYREKIRINYVTGEASGDIITKAAHIRVGAAITHQTESSQITVRYAPSYDHSIGGSDFRDPKTVEALSIFKTSERTFTSLKGRHRSWSQLRPSDKNMVEAELGLLLGASLDQSFGLFLLHQPSFAKSNDDLTLANLGRSKITLTYSDLWEAVNLSYFFELSHTKGSGSGTTQVVTAPDQLTTYNQEMDIESTAAVIGVSQTF